MFNSRTLFQATALFLLGSSGIACSSEAPQRESAEQADPTDEITRLAAEMHAAVERQTDVLSPSSFRRAYQSLTAAVINQETLGSPAETLKTVSEGHAYLEQAEKNAISARERMEKVVRARQLAIEAGAQTYFPKTFEKADRLLQDATSLMEKGSSDEIAYNRDRLLADYQAVELEAIQYENLGATRATLSQALKEGAKESASKNVAIAERKIADAADYIVKNPRDVEEIRNKSADARTAAKNALKATRAAKQKTRKI